MAYPNDLQYLNLRSGRTAPGADEEYMTPLRDIVVRGVMVRGLDAANVNGDTLRVVAEQRKPGEAAWTTIVDSGTLEYNSTDDAFFPDANKTKELLPAANAEGHRIDVKIAAGTAVRLRAIWAGTITGADVVASMAYLPQ